MYISSKFATFYLKVENKVISVNAEIHLKVLFSQIENLLIILTYYFLLYHLLMKVTHTRVLLCLPHKYVLYCYSLKYKFSHIFF